jgi:dynein intermediate chain 1
MESGVMCLDFHPKYPALLAVGCYDGTVMVYDIRMKNFEASVMERIRQEMEQVDLKLE